jgi:rhodanese-related sulfurtransferase
MSLTWISSAINKRRMKHSQEFLDIVNDAKGRITECDVALARQRVAAGAVLIDVREDNEYECGHAEGALHMGRGIIERDIVQTFPDKSAEIVLYCGGGFRSALAADMLQRMGYSKVWSMDGGWKAWQEAGAPVEIPIPY